LNLSDQLNKARFQSFLARIGVAAVTFVFALSQGSRLTETPPPFVWVKTIDATGSSTVRGVATDHAGNLYACGGFGGTAMFGEHQVTAAAGAGYFDAYVAKADGSGQWQWVSDARANTNAEAICLAVAGSGDVYSTGSFRGTTYFGTNGVSAQSVADLFITKLDGSGQFRWVRATSSGCGNGNLGSEVVVDAQNNATLPGRFAGLTQPSTTLRVL
jgi:hypothetical protein